MSEERDQDQHAKWLADFDRIWDDVVDLLEQRYFYREIRKILEANQERFAELDGAIFLWLAKIHAASAAVAVRKQVDASSDTVCLRQLLEAIAPAAERVITRAAFVARAGPAPDDGDEQATWQHEQQRRWHERKFDELAGEKAHALAEAAVRSDLYRLAGAAAQVRRFVNKEIAHRDRKGVGVEATWEDLNGAIDVVEELTEKYNALLGYPHPPQLLATRIWDWRAVFRIPWLLDDRARKLARDGDVVAREDSTAKDQDVG